MESIKQGDPSKLKRALRKNPSDVNGADGFVPITAVVTGELSLGNKIEMLDALCNSPGVNLERKNADGYTALEEACRLRNRVMITFFRNLKIGTPKKESPGSQTQTRK